jgi:flagellar FliJ protein
MTNDLHALRTLLQQAESERDAALAQLRQAEARRQAAEAQAEQLRAYRGQYHQRWAQQFAQGGAIEIVQCYQSFNERLQQAVQMQQHNAESLQATFERLRTLLAQREVRVASVRKLIERREAEARRSADRAEQKAADETAQRAAWQHGPLGARLAGQIG